MCYDIWGGRGPIDSALFERMIHALSGMLGETTVYSPTQKEVYLRSKVSCFQYQSLRSLTPSKNHKSSRCVPSAARRCFFCKEEDRGPRPKPRLASTDRPGKKSSSEHGIWPCQTMTSFSRASKAEGKQLGTNLFRNMRRPWDPQSKNKQN